MSLHTPLPLSRSFAVLTLLSAAVALADERRFALDMKQSELVLLTKKGGIGANFAHNHVVRASEALADMRWDPQDPRATSIKVTLPVSGLVVDEPAVRQRHGETSKVSESDRKKITQAMLDPGQLDAKNFTEIRYESTSVRIDGKDSVILTGDLTLHGVTRQISAPVRISSQGDVPVGDCTLRFKTSDFGIKPYSGAFGTIRNHDEVTLVLHLVGTPAPAGPTTSR